MTENNEEFAAICDGFIEMLANKYLGLNYERFDGGFNFKDRNLNNVGVTFYVKKMLISSEGVALYFDYSDPECFDKALEFCGSMNPLNVKKGFQIG